MGIYCFCKWAFNLMAFKALHKWPFMELSSLNEEEVEADQQTILGQLTVLAQGLSPGDSGMQWPVWTSQAY